MLIPGSDADGSAFGDKMYHHTSAMYPSPTSLNHNSIQSKSEATSMGVRREILIHMLEDTPRRLNSAQRKEAAQNFVRRLHQHRRLGPRTQLTVIGDARAVANSAAALGAPPSGLMSIDGMLVVIICGRVAAT